MRKIITIGALLFVAVCSFAQNFQQGITHYLFDDFEPATVRFKNGIVNQTKLNYNTLLGEMVFQQNGQFLALTNLETIDTVFVQKRKFIPVDKVFYELICPGKTALFVQHQSRLIPPPKPAAYGGTSDLSSTTNLSSYNSNGQIYQLKLPDDYKIKEDSRMWIKREDKFSPANNAKQFSKIFPGKEEQIKAFVKTNKTNFVDGGEVLKLFRMCME